LFFSDASDIDRAVGSDGESGDFALGGFVKDEALDGDRRLVASWNSCVNDSSDAEDAAVGFGAGEKIVVRVERKNADVGFVAGIKEFAFTIGGDREDLAFVAGGDVKNAVGAESDVPDVFCFGIEEDRFFAGRGDAIDLPVGRSGDVQSAFGVESNRLGDEIGGVKDDGGFARPIEPENFCRRATGGVERAFGIEAKRPEIRGVGVGEESKFWGELEAAVAANSNTVSGAFEEFFVRGLEPAAGVFGEKRRRKEVEEAKEVQEVKEKRVVSGG
jgi:hypothetical protein